MHQGDFCVQAAFRCKISHTPGATQCVGNTVFLHHPATAVGFNKHFFCTIGLNDRIEVLPVISLGVATALPPVVPIKWHADNHLGRVDDAAGVFGHIIDPVDRGDRARTAAFPTHVIRHDSHAVGIFANHRPILEATEAAEITGFGMNGDGKQLVLGVQCVGQFDNKGRVWFAHAGCHRFIVNIEAVVILRHHFINN